MDIEAVAAEVVAAIPPSKPKPKPLGHSMLVRTKAEWKAVCLEAGKAPALAFDTETLDKDWPDIAIVGFSLAWRRPDGTLRGVYVPVAHTTGEMQLAWKDVLPGLVKLLTGAKAPVAAHNAKYDLKVLTAMGVFIDVQWFDTMIASWLLNTNGVGTDDQVNTGNGSHGLKDLAWYLLRYKMTDLQDIAKKEQDGTLRVDLVTIATMGEYAGDDAMATLLLRERFEKGLAELPEVQKAFTNIHREFTLVLAEMEMHGVELDLKLLSDMEVQVQAELHTLTKQLIEGRSGEDFHAIKDADLVRKVAGQYQDLDARFALPLEHADYPKHPDGRGMGKGALRKALFAASGLDGHPVVEKIRNDKLRPLLLRYPELAHKVFLVSSNTMMNQVLFEEKKWRPLGEKNKDDLWSVDEETIKANATDPFAAVLLRHRELSKIHGTYLVGMVAGVKADGRVRTRFNQIGARTGRLSSSSPNLQNIPTGDEFPIRKAFVATGVSKSKVTVFETDEDTKKPTHLICEGPGGGYEIKKGRVVRWWGEDPPWVLGVADYSQLEIRLLAHCSNDPLLVKAILANECAHALTARGIYDEIPNDMPLEEVKQKFSKLRKNSKTVNFGVIYGMGPPSLSALLGITEQEAKTLIDDRFMNFYLGVKDYISTQREFATTYGYVKTAIGRRRHLPAAMLDDRIKENRWKIGQAKRQAVNSTIQGLASDAVALAMRNLRRALRSMPVFKLSALVRLLLQIHDELVWESHPSVANDSLDVVVNMMSSALKLRVPLTVDAALGTDWMSTKE